MTEETSAVLNGQPGATYGFFAVATDNVGNVEEAPTVAEATTSISPFAPEAAALAPRYLSAAVTTDNPTMEHAIRVVGPGGCVDAFVDETGHLVETPVCLTADEWSTVYVADSDIVPDTGYELYAAIGCPDNLVFGPQTTLSTPIWGDLNEDSLINGHDLLIFVDAYIGDEPYWMGDLCPEVPDRQVDGDDLLCWIDAYYGEPYPFAGCGRSGGRGDGWPTVPSVLSKARLMIAPGISHAKPGRPVSVELVLEGARDLRLYQVGIDVRGGASGELALQDVFIDATREDYVFVGHSAVNIPDPDRQRAVSGLWEGGVNAVEGQWYLATFVFVPSRDARGEFKLTLRSEPGTMLRDSQRRPIAISGSATATIRVGSSSLTAKPTIGRIAPRGKP